MRRVILVWAALAAGCGEDTQGDPDGGAPTADAVPRGESLLPLVQGATWTYQVTPTGGAAETKTSTVEMLEDVGGSKAGVMAWRVRTEKLDGATVSWQEDTGSAIVRHREKSYDTAMNLVSDQFYHPHKLRIDMSGDHTVMGVMWQETYQETEVDPTTGQQTTVSKTESWTVEAVDEQITVPAGTFTTIKVRRVGAVVGQADKRYWFAPGVGKVREEGGNQVEELASYDVP